MENDLFNLILTEENSATESPPYELLDILADILEISDGIHRSLLYTVLISSNLKSLYHTFTQQGIEVDREDLGKRVGILFLKICF